MRDDALLSLHLWRDADPGAPWRARLTDLRGGAIATFKDVPALVRYLSEAFAADVGSGDAPAGRAPSTDRADDGAGA